MRDPAAGGSVRRLHGVEAAFDRAVADRVEGDLHPRLLRPLDETVQLALRMGVYAAVARVVGIFLAQRRGAGPQGAVDMYLQRAGAKIASAPPVVSVFNEGRELSLVAQVPLLRDAQRHLLLFLHRFVEVEYPLRASDHLKVVRLHGGDAAAYHLFRGEIIPVAERLGRMFRDVHAHPVDGRFADDAVRLALLVAVDDAAGDPESRADLQYLKRLGVQSGDMAAGALEEERDI